MLTLSLEKPGSKPAPKLQLSLNKGATFNVEIKWDCAAAHQDDLDIHALEAANDGSGAKVTSLEQVLSTYNTRKMSPESGVLPTNPDGSFSTPSGGLRHSGDVRIQGQESEKLTIDGSKLPEGINEIPLFATVHKADHGEGHEDGDEDEEEAAFADIETCTVTITDDSGKELGSYQLSQEFGEFNVVQLGSIMLDRTGWQYAPVGRGFTGTINDILAHFS
ncbi:MAG: TerD family protein [Gemmatimonadaceae bacterium]